ncbi:hypothetical protein K8Z61_09750 [Nocardioides sp. TRM66260-LWL]|uniref:hypothetical protein n=1 Tax=Nocardioides sp. TRM66260-LWL TaxID=2874478 RepID=UPI001CC4F945|nr:hypothetical protein [Nocardioides sp. TRM66260-LWL]MBZ5734776.1 hypothetical protein [Nocardioides sp. TRM66260-LWL]
MAWRSRRGLALIGAAVVLALVAGLLVTRQLGWWGTSRTALQAAVRMAPADTVRFSWTDWRAVRAEVGSDVGKDSSSEEVQEFLRKAYPTDATSRSALTDLVPILQEGFGFSPATLAWELLAQGPRGAVEIDRLDDDVSIDDLGDRLAALGYQRPGADRVWKGGPDLLGQIGLRLGQDTSPLLQHVAFDEKRHLVLFSNRPDYLAETVAGLDDHDSQVDDVLDAVGDPDPMAATVFAGSYVCEELAMGQADPDDKARGEELVRAAGPISPLASYAMVLRRDRSVAVAFGFENDQQAKENAPTRARLASGEAPGQGGDFPERFSLGTVEARGKVVTMELKPKPENYVLSDLSDGPVLFATC